MTASRRNRWLAVASLGAVAVGGWLTWNIMAKQGQGALSQQPLNIQAPVAPAFLMALDDSGSMLWETLNNTRDGAYRWVDTANSRGFFKANGQPWGYDEGTGQNYLYVTPNYGRDNNAAIPPLDAYGFARSPDVNSAYFDPRDNYPSWKTGDPANPHYHGRFDPTAVPLDPRPAGTVGKLNGTQNVIAESRQRAASWRFTLRSGMVLPVGTVIESNRCGNGIDGNGNSTADGNFRVLTKQITLTSACSAGMGYYPATFFLTERMPDSYGYTARPLAVTNPLHGRPGTLYKYEIKRDNFSGDDTYLLAIDNFTRWFSLYRTRREALIGASADALHDSTNLRVGWFRINDRNNVNMYDMTVDADKVALLRNIVDNMQARDSTPNRSAATHLGNQFKRVKSTRDLNPPVLLSCQKNAGMLFTDGYINEDGNKTLMRAGVARFYDDSLVPSMEANAVPVPAECRAGTDPSLDCKTTLHMNFYGVVLGTLGKEFGVRYTPNPLKPWLFTPNPYEVPPAFPTTTQNLKPEAVDELWDAVLYTKGEMVNATRPAEITAAMRRIISNVSKGATPSGTRSLTGSRIGTGSLSVEPFYEATNNGTDWYSRLTAFTLAVDPQTRGIVSEAAWEASERMPAAASRNVWFWRDGAALRFNAGNVSLTDLCSKPSGLHSGMVRCSESELTRLAGDNTTAVSYLLGNTTQEIRNSGMLRDRTTVLGDIINSTPLLSSPIDDFGYRRLNDLGTSYSAYLTSKRGNRRYMVYAGGNDGMLHAFDGGMGADGVMDNQGGKEVFGYIPGTSIGHMGNLLVPNNTSAENDQDFQHRYYVDGPVVVGDTHDGTGWKTSLVGTSGAGGRSVFALDVTDPSRFDQTKLLWEINDFDEQLSEAVRENIGHVLGKPVIVPVKGASGTEFKAIFGNGYESRSGKAVLFVVSMAAGRPPTITMYEAVETGQSLPTGRNGLGNVVLVDRWNGDDQDGNGRDGYADTVYAADQKGAVWKFDLRGTDAPVRPLFITNTHTENSSVYRQPIMGGLTATAGASGGVMLLFGTGSFSYVEDGADTSVQGLYGVNDIEAGQPSATLTSANLRQISISTADEGRRVSMSQPPTDSRGWTVVLPAGERMVGNPALSAGVVFMPTYVPNQGAGCSVDGSNWLFGLQSSTGTAALGRVQLGRPGGDSPGPGTAALALSTGGNAPVRDVTTAVVPRLAPPPLEDDEDPPAPPGEACVMEISVAGAEPMYLPYPCGRQSWRQIQ